MTEKGGDKQTGGLTDRRRDVTERWAARAHRWRRTTKAGRQEVEERKEEGPRGGERVCDGWAAEGEEG